MMDIFFQKIICCYPCYCIVHTKEWEVCYDAKMCSSEYEFYNFNPTGTSNKGCCQNGKCYTGYSMGNFPNYT